MKRTITRSMLAVVNSSLVSVPFDWSVTWNEPKSPNLTERPA